MGYDTNFTGHFSLDKPLTAAHKDYLSKFAATRRMKRDSLKVSALPDPIRVAANLPIGVQGSYYVGGKDYDSGWGDESILEGNDPPDEQPGLWCNWTPNDDGTQIIWNEGEKFYYYTHWLQYILDHFLIPWGYTLNGNVSWEGENEDDTGVITLTNNVMTHSQLDGNHDLQSNRALRKMMEQYFYASRHQP